MLIFDSLIVDLGVFSLCGMLDVLCVFLVVVVGLFGVGKLILLFVVVGFVLVIGGCIWWDD